MFQIILADLHDNAYETKSYSFKQWAFHSIHDDINFDNMFQ